MEIFPPSACLQTTLYILRKLDVSIVIYNLYFYEGIEEKKKEAESDSVKDKERRGTIFLKIFHRCRKSFPLE